MWRKANLGVWALGLWTVWTLVAEKMWIEAAEQLVTSITWVVEPTKTFVSSILEKIDLSQITSFIWENAPLADASTNTLMTGWFYAAAWWLWWYLASNSLGKVLNLKENKLDDALASLAWLVWGWWLWTWISGLTWLWLTGLTFVWSKKLLEKLIEKTVWPKYAFLAKYIALAPAWLVASWTWLVDSAMWAVWIAWLWIAWFNKTKEWITWKTAETA